MDATTPPRRENEPTAGQPPVPPPLIEPVQPSRAGGSTAVEATPSTGTTGSDSADASVASGMPAPATDPGPEDPTAPDTAVEATVSTERAGSGPEEPVVPTARPDDAPVAEPQTHAVGQPAAPTVQPAPEHQPEGEYQPAPAHPVAPAPQSAPDFSAPGAPAREVVYVAAPVPPKKKGNRGVGVLIALLSTVVFLFLYALSAVLIRTVTLGDSSIGFLSDTSFYIPVLLFGIGFILLALIVNRAGWWSFVFGSLFVGAFVYLGTIALLLLMRAADLTPADATFQFRQFLTNPLVIAAGLVAREVALWVGAGISARGRRITARNTEARENFDREQAERRAEIERNGAAVHPA